MILNEDIQLQMIRQTGAWGSVPGAPNGILIPRGSSFSVNFDQNVIENPAVFADGIEREPALGNKQTGANGDIIPNLSFLPELQKDIMGVLVTAGAGPFSHTSNGIDRLTVYRRMLELGMLPLSLYYRFHDHVVEEAHIKLAVEGILSIGTKWKGTGKVAFPPLNAPLDATPTELVGPVANFCDIVMLENAIDGADMTSLEIDIVKAIKEKRVSGKSGEATELRCGKVRVKVKADFFFESDERWARARAGTVTSLQGTIVAGADQSVLTIAEGKLKPVGPKFEGEDGVMQSFEVTAIRKSNVTETPLKWVTTCTTATVT